MIRSIAVLGAGTMGAQIAAHAANAGVPVLLLDLSGRVAHDLFERARRLKPDPFFGPDAQRLIRTAGFDEAFARVADADWIIEAVVERVEVKLPLLARIDEVRRPGSVVSTNTSGLPVGELAAGRSDDFCRHFLGTHFFNPPRYLHLLELVPTPRTDPAVSARVAEFADRRLGKGVVVAKDTPNFIANHLGLYGVVRVLEALAAGRYSVEEIDAMTGPVIGRPKSATLRTIDITGLDVLADVARNLRQRLPTERAPWFTLPPIVEEMVGRGWIGEKAGQGFYKRVPGDSGDTEILALDLASLEYHPRKRVRLTALEAAHGVEDVRERIRMLFNGHDRVSAFLHETLAPALVYTARVTPDIANSIDDVDRVMRWGYGWELGPFELFDAIGVDKVMEAAGRSAAASVTTVSSTAPAATVPALTAAADMPLLVRQALERGERSFRSHPLPPAASDLEILRSAREAGHVVRSNAGASLVDLGDGVLAVEFHSKMNAIGGDAIEMLRLGVAEAGRNFQALVVGNEAPNFSAGANLLLLLFEAQEENWDEIDAMARAFQAVTMALKYSDVPVVVAPAGLALGGGCELILHGDRVQAAAETYLGLVEVGVGLIPGGGGTKEMLIRATDALAPGQDLSPAVQRVFETIAFARVSTSGPDGRRLGYLRATDQFTMNRERLLADAKAHALARVREGYQRPQAREALMVGGASMRAVLDLGVHLAWRAGRVSEHDALVGRKLAWVLAGGSLPHRTTVTESYLLDLEREAFLSLCGEPKTQERIAHVLKTGKPLRN